MAELGHSGGEGPPDLAQRRRLGGVAAAAPRLPFVRPRQAGRAELPFDARIVRLQLVIGDGPVDQARARNITVQASELEIALGHARNHATPVGSAAADDLRRGGEVGDFRLDLVVGAVGPRLDLRVLPDEVPVEEL
ncbi:hypothetical protein D9M69_577320 [compost metagenome]